MVFFYTSFLLSSTVKIKHKNFVRNGKLSHILRNMSHFTQLESVVPYNKLPQYQSWIDRNSNVSSFVLSSLYLYTVGKVSRHNSTLQFTDVTIHDGCVLKLFIYFCIGCVS